VAENDPLGTYLNDHLSGANGGCELARHISSVAGGALNDLVADIEADRDTLAGLAESLGVRRQGVKQVLGAFAEKLAQARLSRSVVGSEGLAVLLEMEALSMGIRGKRDLWEALAEAASTEPRLAGYDFGALVARAEDQQARLAAHRLAAAGVALSDPARPA
jgi:hypothetical protein